MRTHNTLKHTNTLIAKPTEGKSRKAHCMCIERKFFHAPIDLNNRLKCLFDFSIFSVLFVFLFAISVAPSRAWPLLLTADWIHANLFCLCLVSSHLSILNQSLLFQHPHNLNGREQKLNEFFPSRLCVFCSNSKQNWETMLSISIVIV